MFRNTVYFLFLLFIVLVFNDKAKSFETLSLECTYNGHSIGLSTGTSRKTLNAKHIVDGLRYTYHINDVNSLNDVNDWVEINDSTYKIVYALNCEKQK